MLLAADYVEAVGSPSKSPDSLGRFTVLPTHERGQAVVFIGAVELTFESHMRGFDQSGRNRRVRPSDPY